MRAIEQVGAEVVCASKVSIAPGDRVRAVIVPLFLETLPLWRELLPGDELRMFEGHRILGIANLVRTTEVDSPLSAAQLHALQARASESR